MIDPRTTPLGHAFIEDHRHLMRRRAGRGRAVVRVQTVAVGGVEGIYGDDCSDVRTWLGPIVY